MDGGLGVEIGTGGGIEWAGFEGIGGSGRVEEVDGRWIGGTGSIAALKGFISGSLDLAGG